MSAAQVDVAIVGGGIAGLATAYHVLARRPDARVTVIEGAPRVGGNVRTLRRDGCTIDLGPDAIVARPEAAIETVERLGVTMAAPSPAAADVHVAHDDRIDPLPAGLVLGVPRDLTAIARTRLLSLPAKLRAACDLVLPARATDGSLGALVERRLGREAKENLVEPLVAGVYGGEIDRLDAQAVMPQLASANGSLIRALARAPRPRGSMLRGCDQGMDALTGALVRSVSEARIHRGAAASSIERARSTTRVRLADGTSVTAAHVVVAAPPPDARRLLSHHAPGIADALRVRMRSAIVVVLAFDAARAELPEGSGILVARREAASFVGATFVHAKWPGRVRRGLAVVRVVVDLDRRPDLAAIDDEAIVAAVVADLRRYAHVGAPLWAHVERFPESSPIPEIGHPARMRDARRLASAAGFSLVGSAYDGAGLAGCLRGAAATAAALVGA